jgi:probable phosphoglycerate mutase
VTGDAFAEPQTAEIAVAPHDGLILRTDAGLMERGLGSLEGRRRLRGEPLPRDVEPSEQ